VQSIWLDCYKCHAYSRNYGITGFDPAISIGENYTSLGAINYRFLTVFPVPTLSPSIFLVFPQALRHRRLLSPVCTFKASTNSHCLQQRLLSSVLWCPIWENSQPWQRESTLNSMGVGGRLLGKKYMGKVEITRFWLIMEMLTGSWIFVFGLGTARWCWVGV
jgi:hypothetical protein